MEPSKSDCNELTGVVAKYGAIIRFPNHKTVFDEEPFGLKNKSYFMFSQKQFAAMYGVVKGDTNATILQKMTDFHNGFFQKLSAEEAEVYKNAKSQKMLTELMAEKGLDVEFVPCIGMVRGGMGVFGCMIILYFLCHGRILAKQSSSRIAISLRIRF
jgi:hypothetical protein